MSAPTLPPGSDQEHCHCHGDQDDPKVFSRYTALPELDRFISTVWFESTGIDAATRVMHTHFVHCYTCKRGYWAGEQQPFNTNIYQLTYPAGRISRAGLTEAHAYVVECIRAGRDPTEGRDTGDTAA
ncbi:MAG: hypothetical protein NVSMB65_14540 [Chloroflexota bacterium]